VKVTPLADLALRTEDDLFAARQLGRECALGLGLERLDALQVATVISELGREIVSSGRGRLALGISAAGRLQIDLRADQVPEQWPAALTAAGRLADGVLEPPPPEAGVAVTLEKETPGEPPTESALTALRHRLTAYAPATPGEELREQNRELLAALEEVRARRTELEVINRELEETNKGVLALYGELSAELERTNQGVVALYAEIDDKSEQLRAASEAKSRFLRSISHELRTPANSVLGLTGLLLDPRQLDRLSAEQTEQVEFIRASASDLLRLVGELLDLAKAESGRLEPTLAQVSLGELFAELQGVIEPILKPGVTLRTELQGADVLVTDPDLLRHVLRNLLSNAAKFTVAGTVLLTAGGDAETVELEVRDTGVGIADDDLTRIFEEFYQAPTPLHASAKGTGLGLPFAQVVAGALGGHIEVTSTVGEGSSFRLRLRRDGVLPVAGDDGA
jgi:signal transduction histidine kinase